MKECFGPSRRRHAQERRMTCPECLSTRVLPIVYGRPQYLLFALTLSTFEHVWTTFQRHLNVIDHV